MNLPGNGSQGLATDSNWGVKTTAGMKNVQKLHNAKPVDGVYGPITRDAMVWLARLVSLAA